MQNKQKPSADKWIDEKASKPFPHEEELKTKSARLAELNTLLDMDKRDNELVDGERGDDAEEPDRSNSRDAR